MKNKRDERPSLRFFSDLNVFFNFGGLTDSVTKIIKLGASDFTLSDYLKLFDVRGMDRESLFHSDSVRHTAYRKTYGVP